MFWWWVLAELKTSKYIYIFYLVKPINKHFCIRSWQRHHPVLRAQGWTLMRRRTVSIRRRKKRKTGTTGTTLALHLGKSRGRTENFWQTTMWTGNFPVTVVILLQAEIWISWDLKPWLLLCKSSTQWNHLYFIILKVMNQNIKFIVYPGCIRIKSRILPKLRLGRR